MRHETDRPAVVETPNTAGEIMTKSVVSVLVGTSVRDVAILLLEKRISAVPVLAANLQLLGMVSEGDLIGHTRGQIRALHFRRDRERIGERRGDAQSLRHKATTGDEGRSHGRNCQPF